ncbi:MAG: hypothetical protein HC807_05295, partial [Gammaproteobacteria bacterium]|nr:hypothetical protein [Gammaproteobacteria bacterium]
GGRGDRASHPSPGVREHHETNGNAGLEVDHGGTHSKGDPRSAYRIAANWVMGELAGALNRAELEIGRSPVSAQQLSGLIARILDQTISGKIAKEVFDALWADEASGDDAADAIIQAKGLRQITDTGALESVIDGIIAANPAQVAEFRSGREKAFNFFVGQAMKATKGKGSPATIAEILRRKLSG